MKKICICFNLLFVALLVGCSNAKVDSSIVWYVENGTFGVLPDNQLYKPIENDQTREISNIVSNKKLPFKIIFKCYDSRLNSATLGFVNRLKEKDPDADIASFNPVDYNDYINLDNKLKKKVFRPLYNFISKDAWNRNKINGSSYQVPKPTLFLFQPCFSVQKDFFNKFELTTDFFNQDIMDVMNQLVEMTKNDINLHKTYNLMTTSSLSLGTFNRDMYKSITDIFDHYFEGILIRKSDRKIVNIYEEDNLKKQTSFNNRINKENLDGHEDPLTVNLPSVIDITYTAPQEYFTDSESRVEIRIKNTYAASSIGYGIVRTSKHIEEALKALQIIYTDKDISNILIYGIENKDYTIKDGKAITKEKNANMLPFGTYAGLGNNLIAYPSEVEPFDKLALTKKFNAQLPYDEFDNFMPNLDTIKDKFERISKIYFDAKSEYLYNEIDDLESYYATLNKHLYDAGLQDVINELQRQLDIYLGEKE